MDKLKRKGEALAAAKVQQTKGEVKTALAEELPDRLLVEETSEGIVVSGHGLGADIVENSGLRDVAFLMRGVR